MINDLTTIKAELQGEYKITCLELISTLKDDLMVCREDAVEIRLEEATMISGHIYQKEIDYAKIVELCQLRLNELDATSKAHEQRKFDGILPVIQFLSKHFKYIG